MPIKNYFIDKSSERSHQIFLLLLFMSTFRLAAVVPSVVFSLAPPTLLLACLLLIKKIQQTIGFKEFWRTYNTYIVLIVIFQLLCINSLFVNLSEYNSQAHFIRLGITPILVQVLLPVAFFLFLPFKVTSKPEKAQGLYTIFTLLAVATLTAFVSMWQTLDNQGAYNIYRYFVAGNLGSAVNVRSIFSISTDLGAISAIVLVFACLGMLYYRNQSSQLISLCLLLASISLISGIVSGARIFIFVVCCAFFTFAISYFWHQKMKLTLSLISLALFFLFIVQISPVHTAGKISNAMPFVTNIHAGLSLSTSDLMPTFDTSALGDREQLWKTAVFQISAFPFFGMSNGGFRIFNESIGAGSVNNAHNVILQSAIDGGLFATTILLVLFIQICKKIQNTFQLTLLAACTSSLLVDYFVDHSLPWIIITSYIASQGFHLFKSHPFCRTPYSPLLSTRTLIYTALFLTIAVIGTYGYARVSFNQLSVSDKVTTLLQYHSRVPYTKSPIMITEQFQKQFDNGKSPIATLPVLTSAEICSRQYLRSILLGFQYEKFLLGRFNAMPERWTLGHITDTNCVSDENTPDLSAQKWMTNNRQYTKYWVDIENNKITLIYDMVLFSPTFKTLIPGNIIFTAKGNVVNSLLPVIVIEVLSNEDNSTLHSTVISPDVNKKVYSIPIDPLVTEHIFLRIRFNNYQVDETTPLYHQVSLENFIFEPT